MPFVACACQSARSTPSYARTGQLVRPIVLRHSGSETPGKNIMRISCFSTTESCSCRLSSARLPQRDPECLSGRSTRTLSNSSRNSCRRRVLQKLSTAKTWLAHSFEGFAHLAALCGAAAPPKSTPYICRRPKRILNRTRAPKDRPDPWLIKQTCYSNPGTWANLL